MTDKEDDGRIGAYAPPTDDLDMFDACGEDSRRGPLLLTLAVTFVVAFFGVLYMVYAQGVREAEAAPRILADQTPYRVEPPDPGGEATPNTDIAVYDRLTGETETGGEATPVEAPEEPNRPALRVETVSADEAAAPSTPSEPAPEPEPVDDSAAREAAAREAAARETARREAAAREAAHREAAAREAAPAPAPAPPPAAADGEWVVQIASLRSQEDAEAAWLAFAGAYSDISSGLGPDIARVEIEGRGVYHRLRIGAFAARDDAVRYCEQLQARGQDCLVRRR